MKYTFECDYQEFSVDIVSLNIWNDKIAIRVPSKCIVPFYHINISNRVLVTMSVTDYVTVKRFFVDNHVDIVCDDLETDRLFEFESE